MTTTSSYLSKHYTWTAIVLVLIVGGSLIFFTQSRIGGNKEHQSQIAMESVKGISSQVEMFIAEQNRLVQVFGNQHKNTIVYAYNNPEDDEARAAMNDLVSIYFPSHFTTTLSSPDGTPIYVDFDGVIGQMCQSDLKTFSNTGTHDTQVHPSSNDYHFDVMTNIVSDNQQPILFISFLADILGNILNSVQSPAHTVMLIHRDKNQLIEVVAEGARNRITRDDYRLTDEEISRILYTKSITGTHWEAVDFINPGMLQEYNKSRSYESIVIFSMFLLVIGFMVLRLHKEEQAREKEERMRRHVEKEKDSMISVIAHEFRTPLTAISGAIDLLIGNADEDDISIEDSKILHDMISNNSKQLRSLVDDFLDIKQLESGQFDLELQEFVLADTIVATVKNLEIYGMDFNVKFILDTIVDDVKIKGDPKRISQVLGNLLSNAVKYGGSDKSVMISMQHMDQTIRISVSDQGDGIPEEFQSIVFNRFAMASVKRDFKIKSSGLGLYICKELVIQHGGKINFQSNAGKGTTFYFDLPICEPEEYSNDKETVRLAS